ncbi:hypothetical protein Tco_0228526 [Tanacetum coccineum]
MRLAKMRPPDLRLHTARRKPPRGNPDNRHNHKRGGLKRILSQPLPKGTRATNTTELLHLHHSKQGPD